MIDLSIITLNYKEPILTNKCVEQLLKAKKASFEVIVIDNSCNKDDADILKSLKDKRVRVYIMDKNTGCSLGYNYGIQKAKGKYILILNNDTEIFDKYALYKMVAFMDKNSDIGVIQPKIKSLLHPTHYEYAGAGGGFLDVLGYPFCRGRIFSTTEKDKGQYDEITEITWASTCAFFTRREVLLKAGLFDPIYFAYAEEVDMSLKIWNLGFRIVLFPDAEVYHQGETAWKKIRGKKTYLIHRNHLILYFKCLPLKQVLRFLPERLLLEIISMVYYISNKSLLHIFPVMLSYISFLRLLPSIVRKRKSFFRDYCSNRKPTYRRSIIIDYFIRKKKYFSQLNKDDFS